MENSQVKVLGAGERLMYTGSLVDRKIDFVLWSNVHNNMANIDDLEKKLSIGGSMLPKNTTALKPYSPPQSELPEFCQNH